MVDIVVAIFGRYNLPNNILPKLSQGSIQFTLCCPLYRSSRVLHIQQAVDKFLKIKTRRNIFILNSLLIPTWIKKLHSILVRFFLLYVVESDKFGSGIREAKKQMYQRKILASYAKINVKSLLMISNLGQCFNRAPGSVQEGSNS